MTQVKDTAKAAAVTPDPAALRAAEAQVTKAREHMKGAMQTLRMGGWPETADELRRLDAQLQVWVQPQGWFWWLKREGS